jgi:hypothetical protein
MDPCSELSVRRACACAQNAAVRAAYVLELVFSEPLAPGFDPAAALQVTDARVTDWTLSGEASGGVGYYILATGACLSSPLAKCIEPLAARAGTSASHGQ